MRLPPRRPGPRRRFGAGAGAATVGAGRTEAPADFRRRVVLGAVLVLALALGAGGAAALTLEVKPHSEECFYEDVQSGKSLEVDFEVVRGGLLDIHLRVYAPGGAVVEDRLAHFPQNSDAPGTGVGDLGGADSGVVSLVAGRSGVYSVCFDNSMSRWTPKVVTVARGGRGGGGAADAAKLEHLGPMVDSIIKIADAVETIEKLQHTLRVRERHSRDVLDGVNARVHRLALAESAIVICMGVAQAVYIRRWFSDTEKLGRV